MRRDMSAETIKMPEPIMTPITTIVESKRLSPRTKPVSFALVDSVTGWVVGRVMGRIAEAYTTGRRECNTLIPMDSPRPKRGMKLYARILEGTGRPPW